MCLVLAGGLGAVVYVWATGKRADVEVAVNISKMGLGSLLIYRLISVGSEIVWRAGERQRGARELPDLYNEVVRLGMEVSGAIASHLHPVIQTSMLLENTLRVREEVMDLLTSIELYLMQGKWYQFLQAHGVEEL